MPCGYPGDVYEKYLATCYWEFSYPCGIRYCNGSFNYPCGVRWCRKWGIPYPCGVRWCTATYSYPCGFNYCTGRLPYPCIKTRILKGVCFDFVSVHDDCKVLYEKHYGCCGGREYEWSDACLGWVGAWRPRTECFAEAPKDIGKCSEGNSIPYGGQAPGGSFDPGSVAPHSSDLRSSSGLRYAAIRRFSSKLGRCRRCIRLTVVLTTLSWASFAIVDAALPFVVLFSSFSIAHVVGFVARRMRGFAGQPPCTGCGSTGLARHSI
jgi:hypothetical protein